MRDYDVQRRAGIKQPVFDSAQFADLDLDREAWPAGQRAEPRRRRTPSRCRAAIAEFRAGALPGRRLRLSMSPLRVRRERPDTGLRMLPVKNLFVLYTGGTIGMLQTPQGLAPAGGFEARMRDHLQSLGDAPDLRWRFAELQPPLDSANMTQGNWLAMRDAIVAALDAGHDGVLLLHGTDTLAYSAAALSFLLLDLPIPVLLTGSMLPAGAPGSDAWDNLVGALRVLQEGHARGVQVLFQRCPAARRASQQAAQRRVRRLRRTAATAPRRACAGACGARLPPAAPGSEPRRAAALSGLRAAPARAARQRRGSAAAGMLWQRHRPVRRRELLALLREAHARGVLLAAVSQCAYGQVEFGVYAAGSRLRDAGLLSAGGMTREAALGKLFGLLGAGLGRDEAQRWFALDLCGENAD